MRTMQNILEQSWQRIAEQIAVLLPGMLAMLMILLVGWIVARLVQWALERASDRLEQRLRPWGFASHYGSILSRIVFWFLFGCAILMGINALNTELGTRLVTSAFLYLPRLLTASLIVIGGMLLARFLARSALIWAVNEGIGSARWIAGGVKVGVGFLTFVGAMEQLAVARTAVLATFVILLSGTVLAAALAFGLGSRKRVEQWLDRRAMFLSERREEERLKHL